MRDIIETPAELKLGHSYSNVRWNKKNGQFGNFGSAEHPVRFVANGDKDGYLKFMREATQEDIEQGKAWRNKRTGLLERWQRVRIDTFMSARNRQAHAS